MMNFGKGLKEMLIKQSKPNSNDTASISELSIQTKI
jgi:hypothetical protein